MNKELQDLAWSILPKEFKEEVKKMFQKDINTCNSMNQAMRCILVDLFGLHNLTSDAEGEEMLHIRRSEVTSRYEAYSKESANAKNNEPYLQFCEGELNVLTNLFGSKCLPDDADSSEKKGNRCKKCGVPNSSICAHMNCQDYPSQSEPKPAEPKFKIGDKVKHSAHPHDDGIYRVDDIKKSSDGFIYHIQGLIGISNVKESDLEPYIEPEEVTKMKPITSKVSICLATKEEDEEFRQFLHENGFKWNNETSLISLSCWSSLIEDDKIHYVHPDKTVTYCGKKTSDTLTFSEFKKQYFGENVNHRQFIANCDKQFDNIPKDSFRNERRLNIAAMAMQGIVSNPTAMNGPKLIDGDEEILAKWSLKFADALIAECELTEKLKGE